MKPATQEHQKHVEEEVVLGAYYDAEEELMADDEYSSGDDKPKVWRNAEPVSVEKPQVEYETKVPSAMSIIALISQRRVDRVPLGQANRADACLPCGGTTASEPDLKLYELPCGHRWCKVCLARAFKFSLHHNTFHRLKCCTDDEIPLKYFKSITEDRPHLQPEYEPGWEPGSHMDDGTPQEPQGQTPEGGPASKYANVLRNPLRVSQCVEKDEEVFINKKDIAFYKWKLEEFETLPKDKLYCHRHACGSFIPKSCRTKTMGTCPRCHRVTCRRCRKGLQTHQSQNGKCDASKKRMEVVKNDRKLMVLARRKGWKRCPRCRMYVEKIRGGCLSVVCQCGRQFFYGQ